MHATIRFLSVSALALSVASCTHTATSGTVRDRLLNAFRAVCASEPIAHSLFITFGTGRVDARIVTLEARAHQTVSSICASNPTDLETALAAVLKAAAEVAAASQHAERVAQADGIVVPSPDATVVITK
jgi:hypothetical protein